MKYIGVFDSGLGGLTVVRSILNKRPHENIVFFGDLLNMPYGDKTREEITGFALHNMQVLEQYDLKALVIACNTADSAAGDLIAESAKEPVFGVIRSACETAVKTTHNGRIGVIATRATIRSNAYPDLIRSLIPEARIFTQACPKLVPLIEAEHFGANDPLIRDALQEYLPPLIREDIDTLVLGCTHYPLIADTIADMFPGIHLVSSSDTAAVKVLKAVPDDENNCGIQRILVSAQPEFFTEKARLFMGDLLKAKAEHHV